MKFRTMDDIEREKHNEGRTKMRNEISEDINEVIGNVFGKPKKEKNNAAGWILRIVIFLLIGVILINLILGNIWLLKFFLKSLFGIG
jgi:hypothetical protein